MFTTANRFGERLDVVCSEEDLAKMRSALRQFRLQTQVDWVAVMGDNGYAFVEDGIQPVDQMDSLCVMAAPSFRVDTELLSLLGQRHGGEKILNGNAAGIYLHTIMNGTFLLIAIFRSDGDAGTGLIRIYAPPLIETLNHYIENAKPAELPDLSQLFSGVPMFGGEGEFPRFGG